MLCANCGGHGHMYRICSQPISSFGVICFRLNAPGGGGGGGAARPEYLMVQRKDSLSYVEFIRGKYNVQNRGYIMRLLSNMTLSERAQLAASSFDTLWHGFWQSDHSCGFMKEYEQSKARFTMLRTGYYLRVAPDPGQQRSNLGAHGHGGQSPEVVFFSLASAIALTAATATQTDTEFGFPKGRRNINESDLNCACREFSEETGLDPADVELVPGGGGGGGGGASGGRPYEEVFTGSNHTRYRHVYYLAKLHPDSGAWADAGNAARQVLDPVQSREVRAVAWFDAGNVLSHLRPENSERRALFLQLHEDVSAIVAAADASAARPSPSSHEPPDAEADACPRTPRMA